MIMSCQFGLVKKKIETLVTKISGNAPLRVDIDSELCPV